MISSILENDGNQIDNKNINKSEFFFAGIKINKQYSSPL